MNKPKNHFYRRMMTTIKGATLREFDEICLRREMSDAEAIRKGVELFVEKYGDKKKQTN